MSHLSALLCWFHDTVLVSQLNRSDILAERSWRSPELEYDCKKTDGQGQMESKLHSLANWKEWTVTLTGNRVTLMSQQRYFTTLVF